MVLWASSFVALKLAFRDYDPMLVIFGRMAVASLCFLPFVPRFRGGSSIRVQDLKPLLGMALCEPCLYFIFEAKALTLTTASQAGMITSLLPLMVAVSARWILKEVLSAQATLGLFVAVAGACWLSLTGEPSQAAPHPALGNLLEFLAMVCATGYTIYLKRLTHRYSPLLLTAIQAWVGAVFFFPVLLFPHTIWPHRFPWPATLAVVYLGAVITLGAYGLYNFGVSRIPAAHASSFINLIPVLTIAMGWLLLGERFTAAQYLAAALVFAGIFLSQREKGISRRNARSADSG